MKPSPLKVKNHSVIRDTNTRRFKKFIKRITNRMYRRYGKTWLDDAPKRNTAGFID